MVCYNNSFIRWWDEKLSFFFLVISMIYRFYVCYRIYVRFNSFLKVFIVQIFHNCKLIFLIAKYCIRDDTIYILNHHVFTIVSHISYNSSHFSFRLIRAVIVFHSPSHISFGALIMNSDEI